MASSDVRFGLLADIAAWMSALPPIADMCSAISDVRFVPIADIDRPCARAKLERKEPRRWIGIKLPCPLSAACSSLSTLCGPSLALARGGLVFAVQRRQLRARFSEDRSPV
jgi:hypothetical protein